MKANEVKELGNKTKGDLKKSLAELESKFADTRLEVQMGKHKNTALLKEMKRDMARIQTVLNQKKEVEIKG